jgi:hypothetical protein
MNLYIESYQNGSKQHCQSWYLSNESVDPLLCEPGNGCLVLKDGLFMAVQFIVGFQQRGIICCLRVAIVCIPLVPKYKKEQFITQSVLRIRDIYPGSEYFSSGIRIKEFKYFWPKNGF